MRRHPSEFYVKHILAKAWKVEDESLATVNEVLDQYALPLFEEPVFERIVRAFQPPPNFRYSDPKHKDTRSFMREEKIFSFWQPEEDELRAIELVQVPQIAELLQIMLLGRVQPALIVDLINREYQPSPPLTEQQVLSFHHYFWNTQLVGRVYWHELLFRWPHKTALLGALACGPRQALYLAGFRPVIDKKLALQDAYRQVVCERELCRAMPFGEERAKMLGGLVKTEIALYTQITEGGGLEDEAESFRQFEIETEERPAPDIHELAKGGSFSGQPPNGGKPHADA